jgi:hypothetical protein
MSNKIVKYFSFCALVLDLIHYLMVRRDFDYNQMMYFGQYWSLKQSSLIWFTFIVLIFLNTISYSKYTLITSFILLFVFPLFINSIPYFPWNYAILFICFFASITTFIKNIRNTINRKNLGI